MLAHSTALSLKLTQRLSQSEVKRELHSTQCMTGLEQQLGGGGTTQLTTRLSTTSGGAGGVPEAGMHYEFSSTTGISGFNPSRQKQSMKLCFFHHFWNFEYH